MKCGSTENNRSYVERRPAHQHFLKRVLVVDCLVCHTSRLLQIIVAVWRRQTEGLCKRHKGEHSAGALPNLSGAKLSPGEIKTPFLHSGVSSVFHLAADQTQFTFNDVPQTHMLVHPTVRKYSEPRARNQNPHTGLGPTACWSGTQSPQAVIRSWSQQEHCHNPTARSSRFQVLLSNYFPEKSQWFWAGIYIVSVCTESPRPCVSFGVTHPSVLGHCRPAERRICDSFSLLGSAAPPDSVPTVETCLSTSTHSHIV